MSSIFYGRQSETAFSDFRDYYLCKVLMPCLELIVVKLNYGQDIIITGMGFVTLLAYIKRKEVLYVRFLCFQPVYRKWIKVY